MQQKHTVRYEIKSPTANTPLPDVMTTVLNRHNTHRTDSANTHT